jgi:hypothetical protein
MALRKAESPSRGKVSTEYNQRQPSQTQDLPSQEIPISTDQSQPTQILQILQETMDLPYQEEQVSNYQYFQSQPTQKIDEPTREEQVYTQNTAELPEVQNVSEYFLLDNMH